MPGHWVFQSRTFAHCCEDEGTAHELCVYVHRIAEVQRTAIDEKIKSLTKLRGELRRIEAACAGGVSMDCSVIEALADRSLCENAHRT